MLPSVNIYTLICGLNKGIAHMLEHMAFKGTCDIGTTNFKAENMALNNQDEGTALTYCTFF